MTDDYAERVIHSLESRGEDAVRNGLIRGEFGASGTLINSMVKEWLASKESVRLNAREEKMLSIARQAKTIAIIAMVLSTIIAIIQIFKS